MPPPVWPRVQNQVSPKSGRADARHPFHRRGLDYVGVSPILADLGEKGRVRFASATDREVIEALSLAMRTEGLIPAMESAHAFVQAFKEAPTMSKDQAIIINMSGRGDKDIFTIAHAFDDPSWKEFIVKRADQYRKK